MNVLKKTGLAAAMGLSLTQLSEAGVTIFVDENPGGGVRFTASGSLDTSLGNSGNGLSFTDDFEFAPGASGFTNTVWIVRPGVGDPAEPVDHFRESANVHSIVMTGGPGGTTLFDDVTGPVLPLFLNPEVVYIAGVDDSPDFQDGSIYNVSFVVVDSDGDIGDYSGFSWVWTAFGLDPDSANHGDTVTITTVPEPTSASLFSLVAIGFCLRRRR
jgi:hypothetical protein